MSTVTDRTPSGTRTATAVRGRTAAVERTHHRPLAVVAAAVCVAIAVIHVMDQGGFPGSKDPRYLGLCYYALEVGAVAAAVWLVATARRAAWWLALVVAVGPLVGYSLTRGPGLPGAMDDRGNWTEPIGLASMLAEVALLALCLVRLGPLGRRTD
jgi:di/tricarboxylate transporter